MKTKKLQVRLSSETMTALKITAAKTGRSMQSIVDEAIRAWLFRHGGEA